MEEIGSGQVSIQGVKPLRPIDCNEKYCSVYKSLESRIDSISEELKCPNFDFTNALSTMAQLFTLRKCIECYSSQPETKDYGDSYFNSFCRLALSASKKVKIPYEEIMDLTGAYKIPEVVLLGLTNILFTDLCEDMTMAESYETAI